MSIPEIPVAPWVVIDALAMGLSSAIALRYVFAGAVKKGEMTPEQAGKLYLAFVGGSVVIGMVMGVAITLTK